MLIRIPNQVCMDKTNGSTDGFGDAFSQYLPLRVKRYWNRYARRMRPMWTTPKK